MQAQVRFLPVLPGDFAEPPSGGAAGFAPNDGGRAFARPAASFPFGEILA